MVAIGDVVTAEVKDVQVFGIFCSHESQEILVLIPEISWIASFNSCLQFAEPGDQLTVKIKNIDHESGKIAATIKGLYPNPWETAQFNVGTTHTGRVIRYVEKSDRCNNQPAFLIELVPGAFTMLCADGLSFQPGQTCRLTIEKSDAFNNAVSVKLSQQRT